MRKAFRLYHAARRDCAARITLFTYGKTMATKSRCAASERTLGTRVSPSIATCDRKIWKNTYDTRRTLSAASPFAQLRGVAATVTSPSERIRHDSVKLEL